MTAGICLIVDQAVRAFVPALAFTLAWTHSIEKTDWQEDYRVNGGALTIVEARIHGSGAGMEPPAGARLRDGVWHYRPAAAAHQRLRLTVSTYAGDYRLCVGDRCEPLREIAGVTEDIAVVEVAACRK
ncbi:MAG: DUF1850 domain-containing protein [Burkholderiales bacterium]|nr:MAG: DUF1850 domain-containing protein [Burkholderiales bacterium]